jgi:hypothetical protein
MPTPNPGIPTDPFFAHDYQIEFAATGAPKEVNIRGRAALPPRIGDHYKLDRPDGLYDLIVETIRHSASAYSDEFEPAARFFRRPWPQDVRPG